MATSIARTAYRFKTIRKEASRHSYHSSSAALARILATDSVDESCIKLFQARGHQVDLLKTLPEAELVKVIGNYDGLVVRSATKVTPEVLKHASKMRIIGRAGVGVDNIDVNAATKHGIMVMNTPGGNTVSTAQLAMSLLSSMARKLPAANMSIKEGKWDRKSFMGVEMSGKTIGIIGCGRIGQVVASCARTMGMEVIGYDPVMGSEAFREAKIRRVKLDEIWKRADFITVHTPLTPETANLLNDATIAQCKPGVRIINCARGGIVDEMALLRALESGHVAGAALDVFTSEPPKDHLKPLINHPNLVCTPHLGASTEEAQINVARDIANQMCDVFDSKDFFGVVNVSYLMASTQPHMKPFMMLAETLGAMAAQLSQESKVKSVTLRTWGGRDVSVTTKQARQLLEAKVLKGLVKHMDLGVVPDLISAPTIAREAGIESFISEDAPDNVGSPYWNLVSIDCVRENGAKSSITGSVFGSVPHIVKVDEYSDLFAFKPDGKYILTFRNEDRAGAISSVLEVLHNADINIATMNVARPQKVRVRSAVAGGGAGVTMEGTVTTGNGQEKSLALCFVALDDDISTKHLNTLKSFSFLHDVAKVQLN